MERATVKSSLLASVGYDQEKKILEVEFKAKKKVYQYEGVPGEKVMAMLADKSIGGYFLAKIKPEYKCTRIEEKAEEAPPPEAA